MKKIVALLLALVMVFALCACGQTAAPAQNEEPVNEEPVNEKPVNEEPTPDAEPANEETPAEETPAEETPAEEAAVMTYAEYAAAEADDPVVIEAYLQAKQVYNAEYGNTCLYLQDEEGAYFVYRIALSQEEYDALTVGQLLRVTGFKGEWAGEQEITDATVEILEGTWTAEAVDVTELLGTDSLIERQNQFVAFTGLTVEAYDEEGKAFAFKDEDGSDIYIKFSLNGEIYEFTVETDLCDGASDVYQAVKALNVGDTVDIEGFLYWYEGPNTHITAVTVK